MKPCRLKRAYLHLGLTGTIVLAGCHRGERHVLMADRTAMVTQSAEPRAAGRSLRSTEVELVVPDEQHGGDLTAAASSINLVAFAQPVTDPSDRPEMRDALTIDQLLTIASARNPTLMQAVAMVEQARGNWLQVGLYPNPVFEWHDEANNAAFDAHYGILSQDIVTANKLNQNRTVAASDLQRARWDAQAQSMRVYNEVQLRFIAALGAQRQVAVAEELLKIAEEGVRVSEKFFEAEEVSEADVLQAKLQLSDTTILMRSARAESAAAWQQLKNAVGSPELPETPLEGELSSELRELNWDDAWAHVASQNPALQSARARATAAQAQLRREQLEPIPNLRLAGGTGVDALPGSADFQMFFLQTGVAVPLYDRNQGNILAASGELTAAQAEVGRIELALRDSLADAFQRYETARNEVETYSHSLLPTAERNLELTTKAYAEGELDFLRVLTARRDLFQGRVQYVSALTRASLAAVEIEGQLLVGGLAKLESDPIPSNAAGQTARRGN